MESSFSGVELEPQVHLLMALSNHRPQPDLDRLTPAESRRMSAGVNDLFGLRGPTVRTTRDVVLNGPEADIRGRLYVPLKAADPGDGPLLLYFHGGGFVDGDVDTIDPVCRYLAAHSGIRLLSVEYRKAPEHPFPAAVDDALAAFCWASEHSGDLGVDARSIAVGGDSAGANLATVVALLTADADIQPRYQFLIYPVVDASRKTESFEKFGAGLPFTAEKYEWLLNHYATTEQRHDIRLSPLLAGDLSGMPPTLIVTAGLDILHDEARAYALKLRRAGVAVEEQCHPGLFHGFLRFFEIVTPAREAFDEIALTLNRRIAAS
jgi:acetyl esterase